MRRNDVLKIIVSHQEELKTLGVKSLYLFGSVARDEAKPDSDVDVLVDLERPAGFFKFSQLERYLEQCLGCSVDLGTQNALREHCRETVTQDLIRVF
ncbi:nucleotidyltransferase family protein [Spirulina sp. CS-785/01]|uniref:nucleotidyltransferase family protein n=1 Tax=Spirulina sp. CS-785/01 TaxID=3021716 RepID=UPI00232BF018|nr:nucleotidyltransferase family protein [Spirulina sp. CS-785/01]MDB9314315.1 nucleotidyltransferase family protein [Spirulina sp. CS-785/01]